MATVRLMRTAWWGTLLLALICSLAGLGRVLRGSPGEYRVYTQAAVRMLHGEDLYSGGVGGRFTYPPLAALGAYPLAEVPVRWQGAVWYAVNVGLLVLVLVWLRECLAPRVPRVSRTGLLPRALWWSLVLVLVGRHVSAPFENQSHDLVVLVCVMGAIVSSCRGQEVRSGAWAGVGAAFKATPLLFAPVFLWQRRWGAAAALIVAAACGGLLPDLVAPSAEGDSWLRDWYQDVVSGVRPGEAAEGIWTPWNALNQSLPGTLYRLTSEPQLAVDERNGDVSLWHAAPVGRRWLTWGAELLVLLVLLRAQRTRGAVDPVQPELAWRRFGEGGAVACGMLLLSPMSSKAHFALLLLPVTFCLAECWHRRAERLVVGYLVAVLVCGSLTVKGVWGTEWGNVWLAVGSVCWCAVACLLATTRVLERLAAERVSTELPRREGAVLLPSGWRMDAFDDAPLPAMPIYRQCTASRGASVMRRGAPMLPSEE